MKTYTQVEFDAFERDEKGVKYCPTGDYSQIKNFGEWCRFEEGCSFGKRCSFGERCSFEKCCSFEGIGPAKSGYPFVAWIGAGSRPGSKTYFFNLEQGIYVRCGCFLGTLPEFREKVLGTHGTDGLAEEYLAVADLVEKKFPV